MTEPLSDAQLAEIRARKAAATGGGRWILVAGRTVDDVTVKAIIGEDEVVIGSLDFGAGPGARDDKTFVVTAGRDIAALLAEVDRLRASTARLHALAAELDDESPWDANACEIADRIREALNAATPAAPTN